MGDSNMLVLNNVTRLNSGDYECICLDMGTMEEISGTISLFVNCKESAR